MMLNRFFKHVGCALWILTVPCTSGQTVDRRVDDAIANIELLKRIVAEQDRRIKHLESTLKEGQPRLQTTSELTRPPILSSAGWKNAGSWARVKDGMSSAQVISVLGKPTSVQNVGGFQTLFYQGEISGSGVVTGTIKLMDDRVWQVNTPVF